MSRTARAHVREGAAEMPRRRHVPPPRRTSARRTSGVLHGYWQAGDPIARCARRGNNPGAANAPRPARIAPTAARSGGPFGRSQVIERAGRVPGRKQKHQQQGEYYARKVVNQKGNGPVIDRRFCRDLGRVVVPPPLKGRGRRHIAWCGLTDGR